MERGGRRLVNGMRIISEMVRSWIGLGGRGIKAEAEVVEEGGEAKWVLETQVYAPAKCSEACVG